MVFADANREFRKMKMLLLGLKKVTGIPPADAKVPQSYNQNVIGHAKVQSAKVCSLGLSKTTLIWLVCLLLNAQ